MHNDPTTKPSEPMDSLTYYEWSLSNALEESIKDAVDDTKKNDDSKDSKDEK